MRILGIDTAIPRASVALIEDGRLLLEETQPAAANNGGGSFGRHAEVLVPLIQSLLERAQVDLGDLTALAVSIGPGSFTGLRIGLATAKGIAYSSNLPLLGVSTLHANAARIRGFDGFVGSLIDARKGEVYAALFHSTPSKIERLTPDSVLPFESAIDLIGEYLPEDGQSAIFVGSGAESYEGQLCRAFGRARVARSVCYASLATQVALLACARVARGEADDVGVLAPVYLSVSPPERRKLTSNFE